MANETPNPPPNAPRTHFHLILAGVFIPFLSVIAGWILAMLHVVRGNETQEQRKWTRLLVALVVVDALVAASGVWIMTHTDDAASPPPAQVEAAGPRIGISFSSDEESVEPRIQAVLPGLPAEKAGLRVGDRIEKIDGILIVTAKEATRAIRMTEAGAGRVLCVRRDEDTLDITVVPELPAKREASGLFDPRPEPEEKASSLLILVPAALVVGLGILASTLRTPALNRVWWGTLGALIGSFGVPILAAYLFGRLHGHVSTGTLLLSMLVGQLSCVGFTLAARAWAGKETSEPAVAPMTPLRAGLQGVFYMITGGVRVLALAKTVDLIAFGGRGPNTEMLDRMASSSPGAWGVGLLVLSLVLMAPISEEFLFRGFLLPRLAARWGEGRALVVSSGLFMLLHPHYGIYMPMMFLYGWVFGWARLRGGRLKVPILLHMGINGIATAALFAQH